MDADIEVDFDGELQNIIIADLPLIKLLTSPQIDTTNARKNYIEDAILNI